MENTERPIPNSAGVFYGETVYWGTILASFVGIAASIFSFLTRSNSMSPEYIISMIWKAKSPTEIWADYGGLPDGHWYLSKLGTGDGLISFALALGVFVVIPAMLGTSFLLFKQGEKLFGSLALLAGLITVFSMF